MLGFLEFGSKGDNWSEMGKDLKERNRRSFLSCEVQVPHSEYQVPKICWEIATLCQRYISIFCFVQRIFTKFSQICTCLKNSNRVINSYTREPMNAALGSISLYLHCVPAVTRLGGSLSTSADFSFVKFLDRLYLGDLGKRSSSSGTDQTLSGEESVCCEVQRRERHG